MPIFSNELLSLISEQIFEFNVLNMKMFVRHVDFAIELACAEWFFRDIITYFVPLTALPTTQSFIADNFWWIAT